jgi:23S rRNA pseudouridine1911/1915/1917 synthase
MDDIQTQFFALADHESTEDFLLTSFKTSKSKLKKFFEKDFLKRKLQKNKPINISLNFINDGLINPKYIGPKIDIIFEDQDFIVLNKPSNIFVHPLTYCESDNCLSFLRENQKGNLQVNEASYDRGLLYRLDYETSGLLIYINQENLYQELRLNFNTLLKEKLYYAKVEGRCEVQGLVTSYLVPSEKKGSKMRVQSSPDHHALEAKLEIISAAYDSQSNTSILQIKLLTGHRHQIRAQLGHLGFPIVGDVLYGAQESNRLYLHAYKYQIFHHGKEYTFECKPESF